MLFRLMWGITDFGDLAVVLPAAAVALAWLCGCGRWQAARWWGATVGGCIVTVVLLKVALSKSHFGLSIEGLDSPSGHTATSTMVYGSIAALAGLEMGGRWRAMMILLGSVAVVAIAVSRLYIGAHTPLEVIVGLLVGIAWAYLFFRYGYQREAGSERLVLPLMLCVALMALATHGLHMPAGRAMANSLLPPGFMAQR